MFCENCGNKLSENAKFCDNCGNNVSNNSNNNITSTSQGINSKNKKNYTLYIIGGIILFFVSSFLVLSFFSYIRKDFSSMDFKSNTYEYSVSDIIAELNKKYHEDFEYVNFYSDPFGATYDSFWVTSKDKLSIAYNKNIYVKVENFKSKDRVIYDDYLSFKYEQETKDFFKKEVEKEFSNGAMIFNGNRSAFWLKNLKMTTGLNYNTSFDNYLKNVQLTILAVVKESDFQNLSQIEKVINSISNYSNDLIFDVWVIKDDYYSSDIFSKNDLNSHVIRKAEGNIKSGAASINYN